MEGELITDSADVADVLMELQESFSWPVRADHFQLIETWERERSGSTFHHFRGTPDGVDVVVKSVRGWTGAEAEASFAAMVDLADTLDKTAFEVAAAVRPLAWAGKPPGVVMPFLEGSDVVTILRDPHAEAWKGRVDDWVSRAGAMLAAYHGMHPAADAVDGARDDVAALAKHLRVGRPFEIEWEQRVATCFGDFGPGNLHATPGGDLYLLDPPLSPGPAVVHRDLANFLFELRRQMAGRGFTATEPMPGSFERLRAGLLRGYAMARAKSFDAEDEALIALFETRRALGMARKRFPKRLGDAFWFASTGLSLRKTARSR
jgi:hypothetical protein